MPKATYQRTDKKTLDYQDSKKERGEKKVSNTYQQERSLVRRDDYEMANSSKKRPKERYR